MCTGLLRRGARYSIRVRIPADLVPVYGKSEIVRALGTSDPAEAKRLCRAEGVRLDAEFTAKRAALTRPNAAPWSPFETREQEESHDERAAQRDEYEEEETAAQFEQAVVRTAAVLAEAHRRVGIPQPHPRVNQTQSKPISTRLADVCDEWEKDRAPIARSVRFVRLVVGRFRECSGPLPIASITKVHCLSFRDWLTTSGQSPVNTNKQLVALGTLLNFAAASGLIPSNPAQGVRVSAKRTGANQRQPFEPDHLRRLFSAAGRPADGDSARYWLPLLGLYTGARLEELAQLSPLDVTDAAYTDAHGQPCTIPVLSITDSGDGQGLKNAGSRRRIPVHAELIRLGFLTFARSRDGNRRLFDLSASSDGHESTGFSKWFSKFLRSTVGIQDKRLVFHSFRHTYKAACRESGIAEDVADALSGHSGGTVARKYGGAFPLRPMAEAVQRLRFVGFDPMVFKQPE